MALTNKSKTNIALKKLLGVTHTSNEKQPSQEVYKSAVQNDTSNVFGRIPPTVPDPRLYATSLDKLGEGGRIAVQKVRFYFETLSGTTYTNVVTGASGNNYDPDGDGKATDSSYAVNSAHAYGLVLSGSYSGSTATLELADNAHLVTLGGRPTIPTTIFSASFSSSLRSVYRDKFKLDPFVDNKRVYESSGALQLVPPQYGAEQSTYELKIFKADGSQYGALSSPHDEEITVDYYAGVVYVQDPTNAGAQDLDYAEGYIYVGDYVTQRLDQTLSEGLANSMEVGVTCSVDDRFFAYGKGNINEPGGDPGESETYRWYFKHEKEEFPIYGKEMVFANGILQDSGSDNDYIIFRSSSDETITSVEFTYPLPEDSKIKIFYLPRTV